MGGPPAPPAQTAPPSDATTATAPPAATKPPLPGGRPALDGTYAMRVVKTSFVKENIVAGVKSQATWHMTTTCEGDACRVQLRREVGSGGFENLTLDETENGVYVGASTGEYECALGTPRPVVQARERYSLRVTAVEQIDGRPTAQRVDAYLIATTKCNGGRTRGVVSYRGSRER